MSYNIAKPYYVRDTARSRPIFCAQVKLQQVKIVIIGHPGPIYFTALMLHKTSMQLRTQVQLQTLDMYFSIFLRILTGLGTESVCLRKQAECFTELDGTYNFVVLQLPVELQHPLREFYYQLATGCVLIHKVIHMIFHSYIHPAWIYTHIVTYIDTSLHMCIHAYICIRIYTHTCVRTQLYFIVACSHSDLYVPVTSLTKMVRLYSRPWDEKSATLKKIKKDQERFMVITNGCKHTHTHIHMHTHTLTFMYSYTVRGKYLKG